MVRHGVEQGAALTWGRSLALLAAVRVGIPLAALAASGHKLPLLPHYEYGALRGDAPGYVATARALGDGWRALGLWALDLLVALVIAGVAAVIVWRRWPAWRPWVVAGAAAAVSLAFAATVAQLPQVPAGAVGWPLAWSVPIGALDVLGLPAQTDDDWAFAAGLAVSLAAHAVTTVAAAYIGLYTSGRRAVGLAAAALYAAWPILSGVIGGHGTSRNDQWHVEVGLHMFSEPLATAVVAVGTALVLTPQPSPMRVACAGVALGSAVLVRPPNVFVAILALLVVAARLNLRRLAPFVAGAAAAAPVYLAFLPKKTGYELALTSGADRLFSDDYFVHSWRDSHLWHPRTLLILGVPAIVGALWVRRPAAVLLAGSVLSTALFYGFFRNTAEHPRYLLPVLPALLALVAAGLVRTAAVRSS